MEEDVRHSLTRRRAGDVSGLQKATALRGRDACLEASHSVSRQTVMLMLKPEFFDRVGESEYRFCHLPDCEIVYFAGSDGPCFTTEHLRVRVGLKEREDPIPLCYCFDFYERDIREEVEKTGETTIPRRIRALVKEGMCACKARNPSGGCCLGEVNRFAKILTCKSTGTSSAYDGNV